MELRAVLYTQVTESGSSCFHGLYWATFVIYLLRYASVDIVRLQYTLLFGGVIYLHILFVVQ